MDRTGEAAANRPDPPTPVPDQTIQVNRDNVIDLAVIFRAAADRLTSEVGELKRDLELDKPWLGDPVSEWIRELFNKYFVKDETSFAKVVTASYEQHEALAESLRLAAEQYGMRDELNAALIERLGTPR